MNVELRPERCEESQSGAPGTLRLARSDGVLSLPIECTQASLSEAMKSAFMWKHPVCSISVAGGDSVLLDAMGRKKILSAVDALWASSRDEMIARAANDLASNAWPKIEAMVHKAQMDVMVAKPVGSVGARRI